MSQLDLFASSAKPAPAARSACLHAARVYLAQAAVFRAREQGQGRRPGFSLVLLQWAANQRRAAQAVLA